MGIRRDAIFSSDRKHRILLERTFTDLNDRAENNRVALAIMMNPSIADEYNDDPTTIRMMKRIYVEGFAIYRAVNLWPVIETDSRKIKQMSDMELFGENGQKGTDAVIISQARVADKVVLAWGAAYGLTDRAQGLTRLLIAEGIELDCFGLTKYGCPRFPLYMKSSQKIVPFEMTHEHPHLLEEATK